MARSPPRRLLPGSRDTAAELARAPSSSASTHARRQRSSSRGISSSIFSDKSIESSGRHTRPAPAATASGKAPRSDTSSGRAAARPSRADKDAASSPTGRNRHEACGSHQVAHPARAIAQPRNFVLASPSLEASLPPGLANAARRPQSGRVDRRSGGALREGDPSPFEESLPKNRPVRSEPRVRWLTAGNRHEMPDHADSIVVESPIRACDCRMNSLGTMKRATRSLESHEEAMRPEDGCVRPCLLSCGEAPMGRRHSRRPPDSQR